ncbi:Sugar or nucleoside kinase, ribokinase family [Halobiforma haloterrestris]|uniref:Sugar or nucleoside kinase, ribokinase family n=1 Tax=Natronobacterium haloterrestre TaxID=148448 RepID=A0A1I1EEG8_NATHA|nr:PfkB family carbohydrate kinase [Halobiforma haloterrestris]SFB83323.1 Sugar or nucleoside kinase, ribokinase family [Halobiforma haloterrestris]
MGYDALVERLAGDGDDATATDGPRIVAFPDGSVDEYYAAYDGEGNRIAERETFGERIARSEYDSFPIERRSREPAGQAVNMARQTHALGAETTLYGHLEDPVFADLPFETVSMGPPARIDVFPFADDDLLLAERARRIEDWTLADLAAAAGEDPGDALAADALCCGNWVSAGGLTDALATLADGTLPTNVGTVVVDPGPVSTRSNDAIVAFLEALGDLDARTDVVYSVNRAELEATVAALDGDLGGGDREHVRAVRSAAGIEAVVLHETEAAVAATRDGTVALENLAVEEPRRRTGAGDRFSAGLAVGRARGWEWETALALANCCAAHYVETATTGDPSALRSFAATTPRRE